MGQDQIVLNGKEPKERGKLVANYVLQKTGRGGEFLETNLASFVQKEGRKAASSPKKGLKDKGVFHRVQKSNTKASIYPMCNAKLDLDKRKVTN